MRSFLPLNITAVGSLYLYKSLIELPLGFISKEMLFVVIYPYQNLLK